MKISIITVVFNGEAFIKDCIASILNQSYENIEYIVIDGGSTDGTLNVVKHYEQQIEHFISEKDNGLYDAINKGINLATGDVVGLLNADDMLAADDIIEKIAFAFAGDSSIQAVYGDLNYIRPTSGKILRKWKSEQADGRAIENGWMPAHPTLYLRRNIFAEYGSYALDLGTAADYDLIVRYFHTFKLKALYLPILMVNMRTGGVSNNSLNNLIKAFKNDYGALKRNGLPYPLLTTIKKKLRKVFQFRV